MAVGTNQYRTGDFLFPKHEIDPKLKKKDWHLNFAKAMYANWVRNRTAISYSLLDEYKTLRAYADGKQDPEIYQDLLLGKDEGNPNSGEREGYLNINWDIFTVAPKFINVAVGMMESQEHDITASAIDPTSGKEREEMKWKTWFQSQNRQDIDYVNKNLGLKSPEQMGPETPEEMALFEELGGFKMKKEYAIERGIDYTLYISDWKEIKRKMIIDFLTINIGSCRDYVDRHTQKVRVKRVDPARLIQQYSSRNDHKNTEWAGELIPMQIIDIRAAMSFEPEENRLSEDQLRQIAADFSGAGRNPNYDFGGLEDGANEDGSYKYDNYWVDVLDFEVKSVDVQYKQKRKNERGEEFYYPDDWGKIRDTDNRMTKIVKTKTVHRGKWIVGTENIFDYGYQFDIPRPGKKEVELSFHTYKLPGRSMVSLIQPNLDQIQLTWLKMQNAIAQASPSGLAVEFSSLQNITIKGGILEPLEVLEIRRGQGDLIYRATTHRGYVAGPHSGKPVQELEGGIGKSLDEFISIFELNFNFIRELSGINRIADASTPDPKQSVGGSKMAVAATGNAIRPIYSAYVYCKEHTAKNIALRLQVIVRHSKRAYTAYYPVLGKSSLQALSIGADVADADFYIKTVARPTEEAKQMIRLTAQKAQAPDKDGHIGLEYHDYLMVERLLEASNLILAQAVLSYRSKMNKKRQIQLQRENMRIDNENAVKVVNAKGEQERKKKEKENDLKKDFETHKTTEIIRLEKLKHANKMKELGAQTMLDAEAENYRETRTKNSSNQDSSSNQPKNK